ncbi:hypothetical protein BHF68_14390 [Desulfuribacillus alkaliarsenatis]|uniref:histidine kinase n=2 Tax=Desulfuribacillus alkaliarsenatis TaxID=766136 RepID=A0A1E5G3X4_9FIRM|nr:hypothetical protein BHF68_14390 [Desulfuribacillus alkaliarsenatis]
MRVAERTEELQHAIEELQAYVYTVSHDLKSPVRAIEGYCQLILEDYRNQLPQDAIEMLENINTISSDMLIMMDKLLEHDRYSKKQVDGTWTNMEPMIREIVEELRVSSINPKVQLIFCKSLPDVWGDPILLRMVLYNLLSNSMKFAKNRETIVIEIDVRENNQEWEFSIADNGVGFEPEYADKLFQLFQRLHSSKDFEGSGIGLSTVKKIIQRHNGQVWITGKQEKGATVFFTLQKKSG